MKPLRVINVVGARPNFMKVAPIHSLMRSDASFEPLLVHTGQHYDAAMSKVFFSDLGMPQPDFYLGVGAGTHAEQTARVMVEFKHICAEWRPDLVLVVGDVNSTLACALVASKITLPVAHVEAGLRSRDRTMPEEINRLVTDALSEYLFTSCEEAGDNLVREGIDPRKVFFVGNVMIDSLVAHLDRASVTCHDQFAHRFPARSYGVVTLHRPSNVDDPERLLALMDVLDRVADHAPLIFPVHPRTRKRLEEGGFQPSAQLTLSEPLGYLEFLGLMREARIVITDSGGIQEETSFLDVPCVTLRANTERPVTVALGSNILAGTDPERIVECCLQQLATPKRASRIPLWEGGAPARIVSALQACRGSETTVHPWG